VLPAHLARHPIATPQTIRVDNGPEFISRSLDLWAYSSGVKLDFSRPGKPKGNAFIESFNGRLRASQSFASAGCSGQPVAVRIRAAKHPAGSINGENDTLQTGPAPSLGTNRPLLLKGWQQVDKLLA